MATTLDSCAAFSVRPTISFAGQDCILLNVAKKQQTDFDDPVDCPMDGFTVRQLPACQISGDLQAGPGKARSGSAALPGFTSFGPASRNPTQHPRTGRLTLFICPSFVCPLRLHPMRTASVLMILLILGIAVRLGGGWLRFSDLTADHDGYLAHAEMVANGKGFAGPYSHRPTAFRPPGYPIALAGLEVSGMPDWASVAIINGLCSIAVIWLSWILCQQLHLPPAVSILAVAITAFDPLLVRYTILPMTEVPAAAMLTGAVVALKAADLRRKLSHERCFRVYVLSGVLFGLGSLVRPILLVSCAMLVLSRLMLSLTGSERSRRNAAISILPMIAAIVAISPWIMRNAMQFRNFIPATTHGGYTLALGNNPDFYRDVIDGDVPFPWPGPQLDAWQQRMIADAAAQGIPVGNEPAQDAWYYQQAVASMKAQPLSFSKSCLLRLRRFCAITPGSDDGLPRFATTLIAVWYGLIWIGVAAAIGRSIPALRGRPGFRSKNGILSGHSLADLWLIVLSFMLLHAFYWTDTRMRTPVMPFVCIISAVGWHSFFKFIFHHFCPRSPSEPPT